jgi:two-component sensor histidine kinase
MPRSDTIILVVDDDLGLVEATALALRDAGFTVVTGRTAAEALQLTRRHRPALLLLDVNLPDGSGVEVANQIKADPDLASVLVVMAPGHNTTPDDQVMGLGEGRADGYIDRPVTGPELLARIDALLRLRDPEEALRAALREKEALVREVHHRAKNNLMLITGLLRLEADQVDHAAARAVLQNMEHRIHSLAQLHELLSYTHQVTDVDLGVHVRQVAEHLFRSLTLADAGIRLRLETVNVVVSTQQGITCGLLVNELVTNALKHAFPGQRRGEVRVLLQPEPVAAGPDDVAPQARVVVSDDGVGLPANFGSSATVGRQLMADLAQQLRSHLEIGPGPGAHFSLVFTPTPSRRAAGVGTP